MKIYKKITLNLKGETIYQEAYEYSGPIAWCKGGTSTTNTEPWSGQQPFLSDVFSQAASQYQQPAQYYPGQTVAQFTPEQQLAMGLTTNRALMGNPLVPAAQEQQMNVIQGNYLNPSSNPWLAQTFQQGAQGLTQQFGEAVMPQIRREAMGTGAYGGSRQGVAEGLATRNLIGGLGNLATNIYGGAYNTERGIQEAAAKNAPTMAEADYTDLAKLAAVGEEEQAYQQSLIDEAKARWEFAQQEPWQRLGMYSNLVTGNMGGLSTGSFSGK